jgi:hypothetical protein
MVSLAVGSRRHGCSKVLKNKIMANLWWEGRDPRRASTEFVDLDDASSTARQVCLVPRNF